MSRVRRPSRWAAAHAPEVQPASVAAPPSQRRPGRPPGSAKWPGSGRKKGTVNRTTAELRQYIHRNANPVGQVCKIAKGKVQIDGLSQADAIKLLYKAVIPELRGEVLTGEDGAPLVEPTVYDELYSTTEVARRIAFILAGGIEAARDLDKMDATETARRLPRAPAARQARQPSARLAAK